MKEILSGAGIILLYVAVLATAAFLIRRYTHIKDELFRKFLHLILIVALMFWPFVFEHWYAAAITALVFTALFYPLLVLFGRIKAFSKFVSERKKGEFKSSMLWVLLMYAVVVAVCWGWRGEPAVTGLVALIALLVERRIPAVFPETSVSDRNVLALIEGAAARGHRVALGGALFSDAMGAPGSYEGTYIGMIDHNVTGIARALGGEAPASGFQGKLALAQR